MRLCTAIILITLLILLFALGIFLLIPFPIAIFPSIVKSQVVIREHADGRYPTATYYWSKLPAVEHYEFYFFNITNPDEIVNYGAKPALVEVGPYVWDETEFKEDITFFEDDTMVYYRNNKSWNYNKDLSCDRCKYEDTMIVGNMAFMSVVYMKAQGGLPPAAITLLNVLTLLLGEGPMRSVPMSGALFLGYDDPFINLINAPITKTLMNILGNPIPLPDVPAIAYFPLYNHTSDMFFTAKTGKDNTDNVALIQEWSGSKDLWWWHDAYANDISGSGDGSFQKPQLKKTDMLKQFQSFMCRAFYMNYTEETTLNGIDAYVYQMLDDTYDTTTELNAGYRYENRENVNYFPDYPCGSNHTYDPTAKECKLMNYDCESTNDVCSICCPGVMKINGTVQFPPGIIPLRCFPGLNESVPFSGFLSPAHFLQSPQSVRDSLFGMAPDPEKHYPAKFFINPDTGSTVGANFRMQLTVPFYQDPSFTMLLQTSNAFVPSFWVDINIEMRSYANDFLYLSTVTIPAIILGLGIGFVVVSVLALLLFVFIALRRRRASKTGFKLDSTPTQREPVSGTTGAIRENPGNDQDNDDF